MNGWEFYLKPAYIAVLMTCYNRRDTTLECLRCLYAQRLPEGTSFKVYLVDDGSTDGTGNAVRAEYPDIHVLQGDGNLYWCGGMHVAWAEAAKGDYDACIWLNDDTLLLPGALNTLLATARKVREKEDRDGIIVGSCCDPETGRHTYGGRVKRNQHSRLPDQPMPPGNQMKRCDTMNGNLVLAPREVFNLLGNLSPEYTHAFGDVDYGMRARRSGVPIWVAPGHLAECAANIRMRPWTVPSVPLEERWRDMCGSRGLPPKQWYQYVKRHTGAAWPFYFIKPIVRVIFPRLWGAVQPKTNNRAIRVGMFGRYYPNYRLGVLNNISNMDDIDLNVYASLEPIQGFSLIDSSEAEFPLMNTAVWHLRVPFLRKYIDVIPCSVRHILRGTYDVFVMSNRTAELSVWTSLFLARITGRKICLWGHGFTKRDGPWKTKLRKLMMRLAHANILYSESGRDKALEMGLAPEKLFIAYNALDTRRSKAIRDGISSGDLEQFRKKNDLIDRKIILFSGRLQERKKPEILVQTMQKVIHNVPNSLAIIVGDGEMRKGLERLIKNLKLESCARLLGAVYDEEIMARYLLCSSVAVMPAHAGLAIQHAFDYGVPIVAGDDMEEHPPEIELVKNGETGIFCKDGDVDEFAATIVRLLRNEEERQRMSANCRKLIDTTYNIRMMSHGFVRALEWATSKRIRS